MNYSDELKNRLQDNLLLVRRCAGWTSEELGEKVGLGRQTINSLEKRTNGYEMTKTQYIAIRTILQDEINENQKDTILLSNVLDIFVDNPSNYSKEEKNKFLEKANILSKTKDTTRKQLSNDWADWLELIILAGISVGASILSLNSSNRKILKRIK